MTFFLVASAVLGFVLVGNVMRIAVADKWAGSTNIAAISRASRLDQLNPEFQRRLGLLYEYDWQKSNLDEAVSHLKRAIMLQPNRADYWADLGRACFAINDQACADQAYENAVRLAPGIPHYQREIANHYLLTGRQKESLAHYRRFLELSPDDPTPIFNVCLRAYKDPTLIWRALLGNRKDEQTAYIYFLNTHDHTDDAYEFWSEIVASGFNVSLSNALPYLEQLIASNSFSRAVNVWHYLERTGAIHRPESGNSDNRIFNGGFEQEPLNAGFDWRSRPQEYLAIDFADKDSYEGRNCLRVDFNVPHNTDYDAVYQIVPVEPNQRYLLAAHLRSADITSDSGPRLRIVDPQCPTCISVESESTVKSTPWHEVSLSFLTGPQTQVIRISVWRPRSRSFPMEIQGHFWLDSVSLKAVNTPPQVAGGQ